MGLRNGDKYYLWEDSENPSSLLGTKEFESNDLLELYHIANKLVHSKDGCGEDYIIYIEDRYLEKTWDVCSNRP